MNYVFCFVKEMSPKNFITKFFTAKTNEPGKAVKRISIENNISIGDFVCLKIANRNCNYLVSVTHLGDCRNILEFV